MSNETVYVLSASYNSGLDEGNMYIDGKRGDEDTISTSVYSAMIFQTEQDAWEYREHECKSTGWQITPFPRKRIFLEKLQFEDV